MKERLLVLTWLGTIILAPGLLLVADQISFGSDVASTPNQGAAFDSFQGPINETPKRIADWFDTNLPVRLPAIRLDAFADLYIFRDSPNQSVLLGREGWLFYRQSQSLACSNNADGEEIARILAEAAQVLEGLDHDIRFVVAPDKASIYPEFVSDAMVESCDRTQGTIMESSVRRLVPSAIDSWGILKAAKADDPYPVYEPGDTHWTSRGSTLIVKALVTAIDPSLWDQARIIYGSRASPIHADLTEIIGLPEEALPPHFTIGRPGITTRQHPSEQISEAITIVSSGGKTLEGSTLVILDSFGRRMLEDLSPFFASSTWLDWRAFDQDEDAAEQLSAAILSHDQVIIEVAERESYRRIATTLHDAIQLIVANSD